MCKAPSVGRTTGRLTRYRSQEWLPVKPWLRKICLHFSSACTQSGLSCMWAWVSSKCPAHEGPGCSAKIAHRKRYRKGQFFWKGRDNEPSIWNFNEQILASDPIPWPNNPVLNAMSASISCEWGGRVPIQRPAICRTEDSLCLAGCYGWAWSLYGWSVSPDSLLHRDGELNGWDTRAVARIFFPVLLSPPCIGYFLSFSQNKPRTVLGYI